VTRPTFKKGPRATGLAAVGHPYADTTIKLGKREVGIISPPSRGNLRGPDETGWRAGVMVMKEKPDDNPNCPWRWVFFRPQFADEPAAREWVLAHWKAICERYVLRQDPSPGDAR
jgi:hypothetical protein